MKKYVQSIGARAQLYKLLSTGFLYPGQELLASLRSGAFVQSLRETTRRLPRSYVLTSEVVGIHKAIHDTQRPIADSDFEIQYNTIFAHGSPARAPLYETEYGVEHIFAKTRELADIAGFYNAFGLQVSEQSKERLDHIGAELEFMYVLLMKEAYAILNGQAENAAISRDAERKFLKDHLGRWVPTSCRLIIEATKLEYYRALARMTLSFILAECKAMNVDISGSDNLLPKPTQYEEFTCPMTECVARQWEGSLQFG